MKKLDININKEIQNSEAIAYINVTGLNWFRVKMFLAGPFLWVGFNILGCDFRIERKDGEAEQ